MEKCFLYGNCSHINCGKEFCLRKYKLDYLYEAALLSDRQKHDVVLKLDSDGTDLNEFKLLASIKDNITDFVKNGRNLYLFSTNCGNGKTSWSVKLTNAYLNAIWARSELACKALFINVPRFLMAVKDNFTRTNEYAQYILNNIEKADLVVWDDIGSKPGSEYDIEKLLGYVSARLYANKSNIFTSNLNKAKLTDALGERLTSRIYLESTVVELHGADKRNLITR